MSSTDERLARIEQKLDDLCNAFYRWTGQHDSVHMRIGVGLFLLMVGTIIGLAV